MAPHISIAIIDSDATSRREIENYLNTIDQVTIAGIAEDYGSGYELVVRTRPMVVILDMDMEPARARDILEKTTQNYPNTALFATSSDSSSENILSAMRAGATEFLLRPVSDTDLLNSLKKVGRLIIHQPAEESAKPGRVITCFSPKGGMGNTTVATNLAACIHEKTKEPVVIVDLDLESGDCAMFLNLRTRYSISDVTSNIARLDSSFLQGVLAKHSSGIYLLSEPERVEDAVSITPAQVREVLDLLKSMFPYVVVDTEMGYSDRNLVAFDCADTILLTGNLNLPSIRNIQKALDVFERLGYNKDKLKLIMNRYLKKGDISLKDAEKTLDFEIFHAITNDYNTVMTSINRGEPLPKLAPSSEITRIYREMTGNIMEYLDKAST